MFLIKISFITIALLFKAEYLSADEEQSVIHISEDIKKRIEIIQEYFDSDQYQYEKNRSVDIARKTLINKNTDNYKNDIPEKNKIAGVLFNDRLYIFVSSSMPKSVIRNYVREASKIKNSVMIMRGFIDGAHQIKPTMSFVADVLKKEKDCHHAQCDMNSVAFEIDPIKFQKYGITQVPSVVYEQQAMDGHCPDDKADTPQVQSSINKVVGQSTLLYAVDTLLAQKSTPGLIKMAQELKPIPWESL